MLYIIITDPVHIRDNYTEVFYVNMNLLFAHFVSIF